MSEQLTAEQYREALALFLAELEALDLEDALGTAERLGRLRAFVRTIAGRDDHAEPIYGLQALRRVREEAMPSETP